MADFAEVLHRDRNALRARIARGDAFARMLGHFHDTDDEHADAVAWACVRIPGVADPLELLALTWGTRKPPSRTAKLTEGEAQRVLTLGAILYRAGLLEQARQRLEQVEEADKTSVVTPLLLALVHQKRGHNDLAEQARQRGVARMAEAVKAGKQSWQQRVVREALLREAEGK